MITFTRKLLTSAQDIIDGFKERELDDVARALRAWLSTSATLPAEAVLASDSGPREYIQLPPEARTTLGDRVVIQVVPDYADPTERVATVCRPLRRVRRDDKPLTQKPFVDLQGVVPVAPAPAPEPPPPAVPQVPAVGLALGAALLRSEAYRRGMKRPGVATAVGVTADVVTQWWTGRKLPDVRQATRVRDVFSIPVDAWLEPLSVEAP